MMKHINALALACLVATPVPVAADMLDIRTRYVLPVVAVDADSFEVIENDGAGGPQMWCAAAIYARRVLGQRGSDLYVQTARGPAQTVAGRTGVVFTTAPMENAIPSYSFGLRQVGVTHSSAAASGTCRDTFGRVVIRTTDNRVIRP